MANELKPGFITGTTNHDEVPHVRCAICDGYYKADEPEDHQCVEPETATCPGCGKHGESNQKDGGFYCYGSDRCCP